MSSWNAVKTELKNEWGEMEAEEKFIVDDRELLTLPNVKSDICTEDEEAEFLPNTNNDKIKIETGTLIKKEQFRCPLCSKVLPTKGGLKLHCKKIHAGPHKCEVCMKAFNEPSALNDHMKYHEKEKSGETPYKCGICNEAFCEIETLQTHILSHTKELPYRCEVCDRAFSQQAYLKRHLRNHPYKTPHVCKICSRAFHEPGHLKRHMMSHKMSHKCMICQKTFPELSDLQYHMVYAYGATCMEESPHKCEFCGKGIRTKDMLAKHRLDHIQEKLKEVSKWQEKLKSLFVGEEKEVTSPPRPSVDFVASPCVWKKGKLL